MSTLIRPITDSEALDYLSVLPQATGLPIWEPAPSSSYAGPGPWPPPVALSGAALAAEAQAVLAEGCRTQAAFVDGRIVGGSAMLSLELTVPGSRQVPMGGVTSTGVLPTHRRRGLLRAMMEAMFADCRDRPAARGGQRQHPAVEQQQQRSSSTWHVHQGLRSRSLDVTGLYQPAVQGDTFPLRRLVPPKGDQMKRLLSAVAISTGLVAMQAAPVSAAGAPYGAIGAKYYQLGGPASFLGRALTDEANGWYGGRYVVFQGGSIYWLPATGAHEVHGGIRTAWGNTGFEYGPLRYPTTDELRTPARYGAGEFFQGGVVYWSPATNAHAIYGGILAKWQQTGWENRLGFPTTDEYNYGNGRRQNFEFGTIDWTSRGGAVANYWFFDKGWTLQTPFDIYNDYGTFGARNVRLTNNNPTTQSAVWKITVLRNGAPVGTLSGVASRIAPGQTITEEFYSSDTFQPGPYTIEFRTDVTFADG